MEINNILSSIYDENILQWKKTILQNLLHTLEESVGYENLDADLIKQSVRNVVANISLPDFSIDTTLPASLQTSGILVDSECDEFINAFNDYNMSLKTRIYSQINEIASILKQSISNAQIGDKLINSYESQIQKLTQETQDKEHNIKRYECALEKIKQL